MFCQIACDRIKAAAFRGTRCSAPQCPPKPAQISLAVGDHRHLLSVHPDTLCQGLDIRVLGVAVLETLILDMARVEFDELRWCRSCDKPAGGFHLVKPILVVGSALTARCTRFLRDRHHASSQVTRCSSRASSSAIALMSRGASRTERPTPSPAGPGFAGNDRKRCNTSLREILRQMR